MKWAQPSSHTRHRRGKMGRGHCHTLITRKKGETIMQITTLGIDLAKQVFQLHGVKRTKGSGVVSEPSRPRDCRCHPRQGPTGLVLCDKLLSPVRLGLPLLGPLRPADDCLCLSVLERFMGKEKTKGSGVFCEPPRPRDCCCHPLTGVTKISTSCGGG